MAWRGAAIRTAREGAEGSHGRGELHGGRVDGHPEVEGALGTRDDQIHRLTILECVESADGR